MFILMIRDPLGIATSAKLLCLWSISLFLLKLESSYLNICLVVGNIFYLWMVSQRLHASRKELKFSDEWGRRCAFSENQAVRKIVTRCSGAIFASFFVGLPIWLSPRYEGNSFAQMTGYTFALIGCIGLYGLVFLWTACNGEEM